MDESNDSDSSEDSSSGQEERQVSSPPADAETVPEAASGSSIDHVNTEATGYPLPIRPPSVAEDVGMVDEESPHQSTEQSRRETSEESEDYEPPEPDTGAESPGSAYSPPLSPAPLAILEGTVDPAPQAAAPPPDEAFMSAPPMPAWESRQTTEILGASGVRTPFLGDT